MYELQFDYYIMLYYFQIKYLYTLMSEYKKKKTTTTTKKTNKNTKTTTNKTTKD